MPAEFVPTDEQRKMVTNAAVSGIPHDTIAKFIGISKHTLYKYFRDELDNGIENLKIKAVGILWDKIEAGDTTSLIFFLKTKGGFQQVQNVNVANQPGTTLKTSLDVSNLTDDQLRALAAIKLNGE